MGMSLLGQKGLQRPGLWHKHGEQNELHSPPPPCWLSSLFSAGLIIPQFFPTNIPLPDLIYVKEWTHFHWEIVLGFFSQMQRQMKIASNNSFHHVLSCSLELSHQHTGKDQYALSSSSQPVGIASLTCFLPALHRSLPPVLKSRIPVWRAAPIYREAALVLLDGLTASFLGVFLTFFFSLSE